MKPERRLRVFEISEAWGLGGTEQAIELRARSLPRDRFEVVAVGAAGGGPRLERLRGAGVDVVDCRVSSADLSAFVRDRRPDIVHYPRGARSSAFVLSVQRAAREARVPFLVETNIFGRPPAADPPRPPDVVAHMSLASMLRYSGNVHVPMDSLVARGHRVVYLPVPGADLDRARPPTRTDARRQLGLPDDAFVVCRVARPDLRKWSSRLEDALPRLFRRVPNLRFVFLAAPSAKERSLRRSFGSGVLCLPPTADVARLAAVYGASDAMVHSSGIGESFGLSVAEAMFMGLPVVVDSTPQFDNAQVELVDHGSTGIVVQSSAGFVEALVRLAADPDLGARMGAAGRAKAQRRYSERVTVTQWERLYASLADGADGPALRLPHDGNAVPGAAGYSTFDEEYAIRRAKTCGPRPGVRELLRCRIARARDTLGYVRTIGASATLSVLRSRLRSGRVWKRE